MCFFHIAFGAKSAMRESIQGKKQQYQKKDNGVPCIFFNWKLFSPPVVSSYPEPRWQFRNFPRTRLYYTCVMLLPATHTKNTTCKRKSGEKQETNGRFSSSLHSSESCAVTDCGRSQYIIITHMWSTHA
jgi:hypothetical protein